MNKKLLASGIGALLAGGLVYYSKRRAGKTAYAEQIVEEAEQDGKKVYNEQDRVRASIETMTKGTPLRDLSIFPEYGLNFWDLTEE